MSPPYGYGPPWGPEPSLVVPPAPYTTDELLYRRVPLHWRALVPPSSVWAAGDDGTGTDADPWAIGSASNDFAAAVAPGMMLVIEGPKDVYGSDNEIYVIDSVDASDSHVIHTRRVGAPPGAGVPPVPSGGIAGIVFHVPTLMPQIVLAGAEIDARWKVGLSGWRQRAQMTPQSLAQAEQLCARIVLRDQFLAMARSYFESGQGKATFVALSGEWGQRADRMAVEFAPQFYAPEPNPTPRRFSRVFRV